MQYQIEKEYIILKNIIHLAEIQIKTKKSTRNLLNKWFQDSIKNYILEQFASPLLIKYFHCNSLGSVKDIIYSNLDKNKPKFMSIIHQYFFYINKFNQSDEFIEKLNSVISNPQDITNSTQQSYNTQKAVRKQFVCLVLLKFFDIYGKQEINSFFQLWNICYPEEFQVQKRLSKYDKRKITQKLNAPMTQNNNLNDSQISTTLQSSNPPFNIESELTIMPQQPQVPLSFEETDKFSFQNYEEILNIQTINSHNQISKKEQINNHIFEEESYKIDDLIGYQNQIENQEITSQRKKENTEQIYYTMGQDFETHYQKQNSNQQEQYELYYQQDLSYDNNQFLEEFTFQNFSYNQF